jgi:hypothetical protein
MHGQSPENTMGSGEACRSGLSASRIIGNGNPDETFQMSYTVPVYVGDGSDPGTFEFEWQELPMS